MCTVTYIPTSNGFTLTSSRDEIAIRRTLKPIVYQLYDQEIIFPKDEIAGGSWIAVSKENRFACLLNGAFGKHIRKDHYAKSRGIVLLEYFNYRDVSEFTRFIDLKGVEPFTLLVIEMHENLTFHELKWDEKKLYIYPVSSDQTHIWSSPSLYDEDTIKLREKLFKEWLSKNTQKEKFNVLDFHFQKHGLSDEQAILMKKNDLLKTVSVSQLLVSKIQKEFTYFDLIDNTNTKIIF